MAILLFTGAPDPNRTARSACGHGNLGVFGGI